MLGVRIPPGLPLVVAYVRKCEEYSEKSSCILQRCKDRAEESNVARQEGGLRYNVGGHRDRLLFWNISISSGPVTSESSAESL